MKKAINYQKLAIKCLVICYLALVMVGCYNSRKAVEQVDKAVLFYPGQTAKILRDKWPCVPAATIKDSTEYKKYMQELLAVQEYYASLPVPVPEIQTEIEAWEDSTKIRYYKKQADQLQVKLNNTNAYVSDLLKLCKDKPAIHDTIPTKDMAAVAACEADNAILRKHWDDATAKIATKNTWLKILSGLLALLAVGFYFLFKKK